MQSPPNGRRRTDRSVNEDGEMEVLLARRGRDEDDEVDDERGMEEQTSPNKGTVYVAPSADEGRTTVAGVAAKSMVWRRRLLGGMSSDKA